MCAPYPPFNMVSIPQNCGERSPMWCGTPEHCSPAQTYPLWWSRTAYPIGQWKSVTHGAVCRNLTHPTIANSTGSSATSAWRLLMRMYNVPGNMCSLGRVLYIACPHCIIPQGEYPLSGGYLKPYNGSSCRLVGIVMSQIIGAVCRSFHRSISMVFKERNDSLH